MRNSYWSLCLVLTGLLLATDGTAASTVVFTTDFNAGLPPEFSGVGDLEPIDHYPSPFSGNFLRNQTGGAPYGGGPPGLPTILTLTGLPSHTSVDLNFLLAVIDSWDSSNGAQSPDWLNVVVDGVEVFQGTWANESGTENSVPDFGFGPFAGNYFLDKAVNMGSVASLHGIPHSSSTLEIKWFADGYGWQGASFGGDESWAIDNVEVIVNNEEPVPTKEGTWGRLKSLLR